MDHADVIVASPQHWSICPWRWVDRSQVEKFCWGQSAQFTSWLERTCRHPANGSATQRYSASLHRFRWKIGDMWPEKHPGGSKTFSFLKWRNKVALWHAAIAHVSAKSRYSTISTTGTVHNFLSSESFRRADPIQERFQREARKFFQKVYFLNLYCRRFC